MMGWGAYIDDYLYDNVTVKNHARAGWSSKTFVDGTKTDNNIKNIQNYYWTNIKDTIKPGDYVFFALEPTSHLLYIFWKKPNSGILLTTKSSYIGMLISFPCFPM